MADVARVFIQGEVDAFVHHVGGEDQIVSRAALAKDGTVITDTGDDAVPLRQSEALDAALYLPDDLRFGQANIVGLCCGPVCYFV